jgi:hypothetical protein
VARFELLGRFLIELLEKKRGTLWAMDSKF